MRGFNWDYSNSYLMHKLRPILSYNPFYQIQYFSKFYSALSRSKGIVSRPMKYGGKLFMADGGQIVLGKFIGGLLYMES